MRLRSQLALSHLKVLLAFVLIHLLLFVGATQFSGRKDGSDSARVEALKASVRNANDLPELLVLVENFAKDQTLMVEVESEKGIQIFGPRRPGGRPLPGLITWKKDGQEANVLVVRGPGRPPPSPIIHVILTTLLAGVFSIFLAFRLSKAVSKPLADLLEATEHLETGGDEAASLLTHTKGPQEIETLAKSFARMSETLSTNMKNLKEERDRAEASEASRRQLISDVSHNLRTPLAAAIGWLDSLIDGHVSEPEPCLRQVRRETLWASQRLERLLRLSRWEHSEPMMVLKDLTLSDVVLEVAENLEDRAVDVGLSLELDIEPGLKVRADRYHLRDLFQILLENIIEHSGQGRKAVVEARCDENLVRVVVSDDGAGFDPGFLRCWSGDPIVAQTGRVSLGLAIARRLAKAHGHDLSLSNSVDGGGVARFAISKD